jgi:hypothetical protein
LGGHSFTFSLIAFVIWVIRSFVCLILGKAEGAFLGPLLG